MLTSRWRHEEVWKRQSRKVVVRWRLSTYLRALSLFCLSPSNWQLLFSVLFSSELGQMYRFGNLFSKPKAKHKIQIHFLICVFAWGSSKLIIFHLVSCPLIFEPCHFFIYHPLTDSCFLITFLSGTWPDVPFWKSFLSQKQKHKLQIHVLICFVAWGSSKLIIFGL